LHLIEFQSRGQRNRRISNENEVVDFLRALPGATLELIDWVELSGKDQVTKIAAADVLVGMHGAGLTHIQYAHDEIVLVELHPM
jgi:capsular polysaccharide biosynthesis protein